MNNYYREAGEAELLTPAEEKRLARLIRRGDKAACARLVRANLRLVLFWVRRFRAKGIPRDDLIQEGNLGLMRAAELFNPKTGCHFSTYASFWIRQKIINAIWRHRTLIHVPRNLDSGVSDARTLSPLEYRPAQMRQQAAAAALAIDYLTDIELKGLWKVSADEAPLDYHEVQTAIWRALWTLSTRERTIICARFGLDDCPQATLAELGVRLHISRERVRQIEGVAKAKLATALVAQRNKTCHCFKPL